uniref:Uncharacterized protein n=1 Tax=Anguilla anguilla TaxID=7936 RepID=A0A0E9TKI1_ANGAN
MVNSGQKLGRMFSCSE